MSNVLHKSTCATFDSLCLVIRRVWILVCLWGRLNNWEARSLVFGLGSLGFVIYWLSEIQRPKSLLTSFPSNTSHTISYLIAEGFVLQSLPLPGSHFQNRREPGC